MISAQIKQAVINAARTTPGGLKQLCAIAEADYSSVHRWIHGRKEGDNQYRPVDIRASTLDQLAQAIGAKLTTPRRKKNVERQTTQPRDRKRYLGNTQADPRKPKAS